MSAASIGGTAAATATSSSRFGEMTSEDFIRIMVEELSNQDPFEPNDSAAIIDQLSGLQNIEAQNSLQEGLEKLVNQNTFSSATALIGQTITGVAQTGQVVTGRVLSVTSTDGSTRFKLDTGDEVDSSLIQGIENASEIDPAIVPSLLLDLVTLNGASLVGQNISGTDAEGNDFTGTVQSVLIENGALMLDVDLGNGVNKTYPSSTITSFG
ncbi:flagellar hook capping FlgD N-terminal domain-containing protein [Mucisphaera calidilacus]|uniref:Basal-body rod modification protein FlgD n=1 Tax=Mucisphaera calidilacus TaxID=2527982 RepID=A0A518BYX8_9BACT|nr:flagellar hook capping FlgD N-terminal domain-containing protein [Mucisphaera calidilacus]QDU72180.1 flagellar basal body rod modification protein [Mucisphaera calidilacus]